MGLNERILVPSLCNYNAIGWNKVDWTHGSAVDSVPVSSYILVELLCSKPSPSALSCP